MLVSPYPGIPNSIKGKEISDQLKKMILNVKSAFPPNSHPPTLAVINTRTDDASNYYVQSQKKHFADHDLNIQEITIPADIPACELQSIIQKLNHDPAIHGIQVQLPLPRHIDPQPILDHISPHKDIDCQSSLNLGKILSGNQPDFYPNTALAVKLILQYHQIDLSHAHTVILNRSTVVGKPLAMMILDKSKTGNATVTLCHSRTKDLSTYTRSADILIIAIGRANFISREMVKKGALVIDVGINPIQVDGVSHITGDADYEQLLEHVQGITPVPGGVGSITTALLMVQTLLAYHMHHQS